MLLELQIEELAAKSFEAVERLFLASTPISREYPTRSAARIAAKRRWTGSLMASPSTADPTTAKSADHM